MNALDPQSMLSDARREEAVDPNSRYHGKLKPYAESIFTLREKKGMTWIEIARWLSKRGVSGSYGGIRYAYEMWKANGRPSK